MVSANADAWPVHGLHVDVVALLEATDEVQVSSLPVPLRDLLNGLRLRMGEAPISSKKCSTPAGLMNSTTTTGSSVGSHRACTMPRGLNRNPPSSTSASSLPTRPPIRPR